MIVPVILSGGSGSRLWPLSRESYPKQFLPLTGDRTLLQETALRVAGLEDVAPPLLVCNEEHRFVAAEQLRALDITPCATILEPVARNTAPAIAVAAVHAIELFKDPLLLVLPADHLIGDVERFRAAVTGVAAQAGAGPLITFGIQPRSAETGYGYIQAGKPLDEQLRRVVQFVEKPDQETAARYLAAGDYYWNSGMFLFRARRYIDELERFNPEMLDACRQAHAGASADLHFLRLDKAAFSACPADSVDYAVMEKTNHAAVLPLDVGWSDVGSWSALWEAGQRDADDNLCRGDVMTVGTKNSYAHATSRMIALVGVADVVVVETPDAVLVAGKDQVQEVRQVVDRLRGSGRSESRAHRKVYRPWGAYDSIDFDDRFQVKRITVNPGASLSLQMHHHRAEHWTVVCGTARITRDDETFLLTENESTFIPLGSRHRLENPGKIPLELIEVQSGSYLGEDDIVRFDDVYGRQDKS